MKGNDKKILNVIGYVDGPAPNKKNNKKKNRIDLSTFFFL